MQRPQPIIRYDITARTLKVQDPTFADLNSVRLIAFIN